MLRDPDGAITSVPSPAQRFPNCEFVKDNQLYQPFISIFYQLNLSTLSTSYLHSLSTLYLHFINLNQRYFSLSSFITALFN